MVKFILFTFLICLLPFVSRAKVELPRNLNLNEQKVVLQSIGLSSSAKILGQVYPLGGYSGVEVSLSQEFLDTSSFSTLGSKPKESSEISYTLLHIGKGLYHNVDLYLHVTPWLQAEEVTSYGGQIRWGFFESKSVPFFSSLVFHAASTQFQGMISTQAQGFDVVGGYVIKDLTLYIGLGQARSFGTFVGGTSGVTEDQKTSTLSVQDSHFVSGINWRHDSYFLAAELDRYSESSYSIKVGKRF